MSNVNECKFTRADSNSTCCLEHASKTIKCGKGNLSQTKMAYLAYSRFSSCLGGMVHGFLEHGHYWTMPPRKHGSCICCNLI